MDYLNQISRSSQPRPQKIVGGLFSKKFIFIIGGLLVLALLIIIIGSIAGSSRKDKDVFNHLQVRISNLTTISQEYGDLLKTSDLRSLNISLVSVLSNTSNEIASFIPPAKDDKKPNPFVEKEQPDLDALTATLDHAHLNGYLDRIFSNEIALRVSMLMSLELEANSLASDATLKSALEKSYNSLEKLYKKFSEFSDTSSNAH